MTDSFRATSVQLIKTQLLKINTDIITRNQEAELANNQLNVINLLASVYRSNNLLDNASIIRTGCFLELT